MLRLLLWNIEWASPRSRRGRTIQGIVSELQPDLICVTEGVAGMLPEEGHTIQADADYGYAGTGDRRKVLLWSRRPWEDVDTLGDREMPGGRFLAGTTAGLRVVGVCVPWRDAHVRTGRGDRACWEDHLAYLAGLRRVLEAVDGPAVVVGDFNQRVPRRGQPARVYEALRGALGTSWGVVSESVVDEGGGLLIDHVVVGGGVGGEVTGVVPRRAPDGVRLSDHPGVLAEVRLGLDG